MNSHHCHHVVLAELPRGPGRLHQKWNVWHLVTPHWPSQSHEGTIQPCPRRSRHTLWIHEGPTHTPPGSVLSPADWAIFLRPKLEGVTFLPSISLSQTKPELLWWQQGATWSHAPLCLWSHVSYFLFLCSLHSWAIELPPSCSSNKPGAVPSLGFCSGYSLCLDVYVHG